MAHFNFEASVTRATKMDAAIERGPLMRWQRKAVEAGLNRLTLADASSCGQGPRSASVRTPASTPKTPLMAATPGSPAKTPALANSKTPGRANPKKPDPSTPYHHQQDRFIPNRSAMDLDGGHHRLVNSENVDPATGEMSPRTFEYRRKVREATGQEPESKILAFRQKAPAAREGLLNNLKVLYEGTTKSTTNATGLRHIPQQAEQILDAPEIVDDYYLHILDWSSQNLLTAAVGSDVFLWNAATGDITQLFSLEQPDEYVSCVKYVKEGNVLAVGTSSGPVQLWDVVNQKKVRTMTSHVARVGAMSWNSYILSSGSRSGSIHNHDVRVAEHHVGSLLNHQQEVCGLAWSHDGRFLASGGNDNLLNIWDATLSNDDVTPLYTFTDHQAAVKALAWCPWQSTLLASGGGTADRHIRFWSVSSGACLQSCDTGSQVSSILWSAAHKELVSGHGYVQNQLSLWKYPSMTRIANLTGHFERILCLALSPDGTVVASIGADETIRLWRCFDYSEKKKKSSKSTSQLDTKLGRLNRGIR